MTVTESSIVASLKELETVLLETPVPDERDSHALNPNYTQQLKAFRGMTDQAEILSDVVSCHLLEALEAHSPGRELKVLSVGCGYGVMDSMILTKVLASCPTALISYTGLDINPQFCAESEVRLQHLSVAKNVICESFETVDSRKLDTYDFIYLVHVHYYFQHLKLAFSKIKQLLNSEGNCVVIAAPPLNLQIKLMAQFWRHEGKYYLRTMDDAVKVLEDIGIPYQLRDITTKLDLSSCFKDGWSSNFSRFVLDFLCGTNLTRYPDNISKLCIACLTAAASEGPGEFVLPLHAQVAGFKA